MPTRAQLENEYDCPVYVANQRIPESLKTRQWFKDRGVKISRKTIPDAVQGRYGSYVKYFLFDVNNYELDFHIEYRVIAHVTKTDYRVLFCDTDKTKAQEFLEARRGALVDGNVAVYQLTEEKIYPVKI